MCVWVGVGVRVWLSTLSRLPFIMQYTLMCICTFKRLGLWNMLQIGQRPHPDDLPRISDCTVLTGNEDGL